MYPFRLKLNWWIFI